MESPHRHSPELQKLTSRTPPLPIYGGENRICDRKSCNFSNVKIFILNRATKALEAGFNEIIESGGEALQYCPAHLRRLLCQPSQHRVRHRSSRYVATVAAESIRHSQSSPLPLRDCRFRFASPRCSLPLESLRRILFGHPLGECRNSVSEDDKAAHCRAGSALELLYG